MKARVAIDAMGGDNAPDEIVKGLSEFANSGHSFILFGDKQRLMSLGQKYLSNGVDYEIVDCKDVVSSDMPVTQALRLSKTSSMGMAIWAVKNGEADVVVSAGNTGAYMASAKIILKTLNGIDRPAIAGTMPGVNGQSVMLDLGANSECSVRNLVEFSVMGEALARIILKKENPSVALLNIGSENIKGNPIVKQASEIVQKVCPNYVGFVEGNDILGSVVDVIVADGFSGNIALKSIEGTAKFLLSTVKGILKESLLNKIAAAMLMKSLKGMSAKYDPRKHNGAILIGLNGLVVKSHGNSDAVGTASAVKFAIDIASNNLLEKIKNQIDGEISLDGYLS